MSNILISEGTQTALAANQNGTEHIPFLKLDAGIGSARQDWNGTIPFVGNLNTGTISNLNAGTITRLGGGSVVVTAGTILAGTINRGTFQSIGTSIRHVAEFATAVTLTGTATGTLQAAVSGSVHYVTSAIVSVESTGRVTIASGTPTSPILGGTMNFAANGGLMASPLNPPARTISGSALVFNQSGTGIISVWVSGYTE